MIVHTIQLAQWRKLKDSSIPLINTTVKSGIPALAPSWDIVMGIKSGEITEAEYTKSYLELLAASVVKNPEVWRSLLEYEELAFSCYCSKGKFCHRHLLATFFKEYGESRGDVITLAGEIE